jgi:multidrug efflux pump
VAKVELGAEEANMVAKYGEKEAVYLGVWPLIGVNEIDVSHRLQAEMARIAPTLPADIEMHLAYDATTFMQDALKEITKTLTETILIVGLVVFLFMGSLRTALVPLVAMPISLVGAALVMYAAGFSLNLLTILAIVLSVGLVVDDAIVVVENVERHVREGKTRMQAAIVGARELVGPDHRHDHHARHGVRADRLPGWSHRLALPRVRDHPRRGGGDLGSRRRDPLADDELPLRA